MSGGTGPRSWLHPDSEALLAATAALGEHIDSASDGNLETFGIRRMGENGFTRTMSFGNDSLG